jgi:hypothetical protein
MASWRETTPQPVQDDLDNLWSSGMELATSLLEKNGEFFPFGMTMDLDGQIAIMGADPGLGEQPPSMKVLEFLYDVAAGTREGYRAVAFMADMRVNGADAIGAELEHRDGGPALLVYLPYAKKGLVKKSYSYGQMGVSSGTRRVWQES